MNGGFNSSYLASTELDGTSGFLYIAPDDEEDGLCDYSPGSFTDTNGANSWILVQGN